jgi:hypothetical protein
MKNTNEWRTCIDYTDLNKHCPKDPFGLPRIDQVIESMAGCDLLCFLDCYSRYHQIAIKEEDDYSMAGCDLLCFLDCYSRYHQIAIKEEDQEKTKFITPLGTYCYMTMSFGLKNADAVYQ